MRLLTILFLFLLTVPMSLTAAAADGWRAEASPYDIERIDGADAALQGALRKAFDAGTPKDIQVVRRLLKSQQPIEGEALLGNWRCRTIKMGGNFAQLIGYGWFRCRISMEAGGLFFEKLTGSQRTSGYLRPVYPVGDGDVPVRYIYLGAGHYGYEEKRAYGGPSNTLRRVSENRDDPGILEAIDRSHLRIGFPLPVVESDYDFLELMR